MVEACTGVVTGEDGAPDAAGREERGDVGHGNEVARDEVGEEEDVQWLLAVLRRRHEHLPTPNAGHARL